MTYRTITAKFSSKCPACGTMIRPGVKVRWVPGQPARHADCPLSREVPAWRPPGPLTLQEAARKALESVFREIEQKGGESWGPPEGEAIQAAPGHWFILDPCTGIWVLRPDGTRCCIPYEDELAEMITGWAVQAA